MTLLTELLPRRIMIFSRSPQIRNEFAPELISAALAGLYRRAYLLARVVHMRDESVIEELRILTDETVFRCAEEKGVQMDTYLIFRISSLSIKNVIAPPRCRACRGLGEQCDGSGLRGACTACAGAGYHSRASVRITCADLGIGAARWRLIEPVYNQINARLRADLIVAGLQLQHQLLG